MENTKYTLKSLFTQSIQTTSDNTPVKVDKVIIPRIQRPYVQGRVGENEERIRKNFLDVIFKKCFENNQVVDLNFMYGSVTTHNGSTILELLDGQQRFTTLYLLYWYFICKEENANGTVDEEILQILTKFSYETRMSSKDFCAALAKNRCNISKTTPSQAIRTSRWYHNSFEKDPSIEAMLVMLDAIDEKYRTLSLNDEISYIQGLENLQFNVLLLKEFQMSEDLYMKMNARGLPLSAFDNFKSQLMGKLGDSSIAREECQYKGNTLTFEEAFSIKIDTDWADFFWRQDNNCKFDTVFMKFFSRFFASRYLYFVDKLPEARLYRDDDTFEFFYNKSEKNTDYLGFDYYDALLTDPKLFIEVDLVLDALCKNSSVIAEYLSPIWSEKKVDNYFIDPDCGFKHQDMAIFSAIIDYIINRNKKNNGRDEDLFDIEGFKSYMRVVWNIVGNSDIDNKERLAVVVRAIHELAPAISNRDLSFYKALSEMQVDGDYSTERETTKKLLLLEIEKAKRIVEDSSWLDVFLESEQDQFLKGFVTFLFVPDIQKFKHRLAMEKLIFGAHGVNDAFRNEHILMRALFAKFETWDDLYKQNITEDVEGNNFLKLLLTTGKNQRCLSLVNEFLNQLFDSSISEQELLENLQKVIIQENESLNHDNMITTQGEVYRLYKFKDRLLNDIEMWDWFAHIHKPFRIRDFNKRYAIGIPNTYYDRIIPDSDRNLMMKKLCEDLNLQIDYVESKIYDYANNFGSDHNFFSSICCSKNYNKFELKIVFDSTFKVFLKTSNRDTLEQLGFTCEIVESAEEQKFTQELINAEYDNKAFYNNIVLEPLNKILSLIDEKKKDMYFVEIE